MIMFSVGRRSWRRCLMAEFAAAVAAMSVVPIAIATPPECQTRWLDGVPTSDVYYSGGHAPGVRAFTMWDPDGEGPEPARLVAGGAFDTIGGIGSPQVAAWVPGGRTFTALGEGFTAPATSGAHVTAVATAPRADGGQDLFAAGKIVTNGGMAVNGIARWDGSNWRPLGSGLGPIPPAFINVTYMMVGCPNGSLVVAGTFTSAGGLPATGLAQWDGADWSIPATVAGGVSAVACLPDNSLIIGGNFTAVNGDPIVRVARIQSGVAMPMGGEQIGDVSSLAVTPNRTVYATSDAPTMRIWRWDDGTWTQIGSATTTQYTWDLGAAKIISLSDDTIALAGYFTSLDGEAIANLARYDGNSWAQVGNAQSSYGASQLPDGRIVTARTELEVSTLDLTWPLLGPVPTLTNGIANAIEYFEGDLVVAGIFTSIQGDPVTSIARRTAEGWQQLGSLQGVTDLINHNGTLYAAGTFAGHVARWNGEQWIVERPLAVRAGTPPILRYDLTEHNGSLVVSYFDGFSQFQELTSAGWNALSSISTIRMRADVVSAEGHLYAGGRAGTVLRRLDDSQWIPVAVNDLAFTTAYGLGTHQGHLYICYPTPGETYSSSVGATVARSDGESFMTVGRIRAPIRAFVSAPNGDLYGMSEQSVAYRIRDGVIQTVAGGLGTYDTSLDWIQIAAGEHGEVSVLRRRTYGDNDFAEVLDPRPVALRDVPTEALVCGDGRAEVSVRVLGTLDRTLQWEWDGGGEFAPIADGLVAGLGIVIGSTAEAISLDQVDGGVIGTHLRLIARDACSTAVSSSIEVVPGSADTHDCARCSPCVSDYDQSGSLDVADVSAFFADFESGRPCADVDRDGGVSGADIGAFFLHLDAGSC